MYQEPGLAWQERQAVVAEDLVDARRVGPPVPWLSAAYRS
jgi:hypothetical protein